MVLRLLPLNSLSQDFLWQSSRHGSTLRCEANATHQRDIAGGAAAIIALFAFLIINLFHRVCSIWWSLRKIKEGGDGGGGWDRRWDRYGRPWLIRWVGREEVDKGLSLAGHVTMCSAVGAARQAADSGPLIQQVRRNEARLDSLRLCLYPSWIMLLLFYVSDSDGVRITAKYVKIWEYEVCPFLREFGEQTRMKWNLR